MSLSRDTIKKSNEDFPGSEAAAPSVVKPPMASVDEVAPSIIPPDFVPKKPVSEVESATVAKSPQSRDAGGRFN